MLSTILIKIYYFILNWYYFLNLFVWVFFNSLISNFFVPIMTDHKFFSQIWLAFFSLGLRCFSFIFTIGFILNIKFFNFFMFGYFIGWLKFFFFCQVYKSTTLYQYFIFILVMLILQLKKIFLSKEVYFFIFKIVYFIS